MQIQLSRKIYRELINGNLINKKIRNGEHLEPNPLFDELASEINRVHYDQLYSCIGYELKQLGDCFFLNEMGKDEMLSDVAMRIQSLLVILCRGITQIPLLISVITDFNAGLSREHIEKISETEEYQNILNAVGLKNSLIKEIENVLVVRKIAFWNHLDRLVLSDGGIALLDSMQELSSI
ncbi:condensin complex protein MksE [Sessilibacter sp. MAH2]